MRPLPVVVCSLLLLASSPASTQTISENVTVAVTNVDVRVSRHGKNVRALTAADFEVYEDGVRQPITNFYVVSAPVTHAPGSAPAPEAQDERFRRRVLLLVDNTHMNKITRNRALTGVETFIKDEFHGGAYDWTIATVDHGVNLILPQTSDKTSIHTALDFVRRTGGHGDQSIASESGTVGGSEGASQPLPTPTVSAALDRDDIGAFNAAFAAQAQLMRSAHITRSILEAVRAYTGTPGKKIVLIVTDDLGFHDLKFSSASTAEVAREIIALRNAIVQEANTSNVSLYILNSAGLIAPGDVAAHRPDTQLDSMSDNSYMYWITRETGGRMMPGNRTDISMQQFEAASSEFYSLGYRSPHPEDGKYHAITVKIPEHPEYELTYRSGYAEASPDLELERALQSPLASAMWRSTLPVKSIVSDGKLTAAVPANRIQFVPSGDKFEARLDFFLSMFDENGNNLGVERFTQAATATEKDTRSARDVFYTMPIKTAKRPLRIVVAVRDSLTEAVGIAVREVQK